jgi:hypothetical protein
VKGAEDLEHVSFERRYCKLMLGQAAWMSDLMLLAEVIEEGTRFHNLPPVVFREIPPQHFATPSGMYDITHADKNSKSCRSIPADMVASAFVRNSRAAAVFTYMCVEKGMCVMANAMRQYPSTFQTVARCGWGQHKRHHGTTDCTHFDGSRVPFGPSVMGGMVRALVVAIARALKG